MKRNTWMVTGLLIAACLMIPAPVFAKPERIELESRETKTGKSKAKVLAKQVDLTRVQDPEVQLALQAIFNALNLKTKKPAQ